MKPRLAIARKEARAILSERTILLAVVIQVVVAGFSSFLVVGLSALFDPGAVPASLALRVGTNEAGPVSDALLEEGLSVVFYEDAGEALSAFQAGLVEAVVLTRSDDPLEVTVVLPDGEFAATLTIVKVKTALERVEERLRDERGARLEFEPVAVQAEESGGSYGFVFALLIPLLVFLPPVLAGALVVDAVTEEIQRNTMPLLLASPATPGDILEGKLAANVLFVPILAGAWLLLLAANGLVVPLAGALGILAIATATGIGLGVVASLVALLTRDRERAHVLYASLLILFFAVSLLLPVSPPNAVALLAAGSANQATWLFVGASLAIAGAAWLALRMAFSGERLYRAITAG